MNLKRQANAAVKTLFPYLRAALISVITFSVIVCVACPANASGDGQKKTSQSTQNEKPLPRSSFSNLNWLEGHWQGTWGPRIAEQMWTAAKAGEMVGIFREIENDKTLVIELFTLIETPDGIQYLSRHFTPTLTPWENSGPVVLMLASADSNQAIFENRGDGKPKREIFTRMGPDAYVWRSEIVPDRGEMQVVEITYHRISINGGNAGRR